MEIVLVEYVSKYPAQQTVQVQDDVEEIVLGRSLENAVCIKSLCISRRHAVIRKTATGYEIQDQQAVNRIHVNGVILPSGASKVLSSHDHIQLGLKAGPTEKGSEYFIYEITFDENRKRKLSPTFSPANVKQSKSEPGLFDLTSSSEEKSSERSESTLKVEIKPLEAAEAQAEHEKVEMEKMELEKELAVLREQQDAQRVKEEALRQQLLELQGEQTKKAEELAKRLQDKEKEFEEVKDEQMRNANQMSKKLQEQEHELEKAKAHEKQLKVLEDELKETREKQEQLANISAKIAVQEKIADLLGDQLQCSICSELMIQPKSFACSHAFCSHCIEQWLKIKKECPVCRAKFTSATHNHLLSNLIQKAVEELSDESKLLRDTLIKEREEEMAAKNTEKCKTKKSSSRRLSRPPRSAATRTASAANSTITTSTRANRTITTTAVTTNLTNTTTSVTTNPTNASTSMPPAASGIAPLFGTGYRIPRITSQPFESTPRFAGTPMEAHFHSLSGPRYPRTVLLNDVPLRPLTSASFPQTNVHSITNGFGQRQRSQKRQQSSLSVNSHPLRLSVCSSTPIISITSCVNLSASSKVTTHSNSSATTHSVTPSRSVLATTSNSQNIDTLSYHATVGQVAYQFSLPRNTKFPIAIKTLDGFLHWVAPQSSPPTALFNSESASIPCSIMHVTKP